jgi:glutamine amidotransferase
MGWNQVTIQGDSRLLDGIDPNSFFYFAHSFAVTDSEFHPSAVCTHGAQFAAVIEHKNIQAVQFHPEKSGDAGVQLLKNFLTGCR